VARIVSGGKMNVQLKFLCLLLIAFMITACESLGVSTQPTAPGEINVTIESPSPTTGQITYPQMTGTAQAIPTVPFVIEPTQTPAMPRPDDPVVISPNGLYAIACKDPFFILFNTQTKEIISTFGYFPIDCKSDIHWATDSSYALFGVLYRWHVDGSQPKFVHVNIVEDPNYYNCNGKGLWSPDGQLLAIDDCGIYVIRPFDESSLQNPLLIEKTGYEDLKWATPRLLIVFYHRAYGFYDVPRTGAGNWIGGWDKDGTGCLEQPPLISTDEYWVVFDASEYQCGMSGPAEIYQYSIADLEKGSIQIFSNTFGNLIDFIGWSKDSKEFYFISRPINSNIKADPRTPFGLLAMNPQTLQIDSLFEEAQFAEFNADLTSAYVVFPARNEDGGLRFDGGLWQFGSKELIGRQIMFYGEPKEEQFPSSWAGPMYSASGVELADSSQIRTHPIPAYWSHDNERVALINAEHELVVISLNGDIQVLGRLNTSDNWFYPVIKWSGDDGSLDVDGVTWPLP